MNNVDRRALEVLRHILMTDFDRQQDDYYMSTNGLVSFDEKPVAPRVNWLKELGYDREP